MTIANEQGSLFLWEMPYGIFPWNTSIQGLSRDDAAMKGKFLDLISKMS